SATCDVTSQVISDLNYIASNWAASPAYYRVNGKAIVGFFSPDYNACPDPTASDCQTIDWDAVAQYTPTDLAFIFENKGGTTHAHTGGAYSWLSTGAYPTGNTNYGVSYLHDFNSTAASYASSELIIGSAF